MTQNCWLITNQSHWANRCWRNGRLKTSMSKKFMLLLRWAANVQNYHQLWPIAIANTFQVWNHLGLAIRILTIFNPLMNYLRMTISTRMTTFSFRRFSINPSLTPVLTKLTPLKTLPLPLPSTSVSMSTWRTENVASMKKIPSSRNRGFPSPLFVANNNHLRKVSKLFVVLWCWSSW